MSGNAWVEFAKKWYLEGAVLVVLLYNLYVGVVEGDTLVLVISVLALVLLWRVVSLQQQVWELTDQADGA
ncbi:hypothetical protein ACFQH6_20700 [Halobacteriaceae archaeon GCM10025711]